MKAIWNGGGSSRNQITAYIVAAFFALTVMLSGNVAEAGANIHYRVTDVTVEPGKCTIYGYFYNDGDSSARVKIVHFFGNVAGYNIDVTFQGNDLNVGYVDEYDSREWSFTIIDNRFTNYNDSAPHNLQVRTTFGN